MLFLKTYRVYRIFTSFFVVNLNNRRLWAMWAVLLLVDVVRRHLRIPAHLGV